MTTTINSNDTIHRQTLPAFEKLDLSELGELTSLEEYLLDNVNASLANGLEILHWWQRAEAQASIREVFPLMREPSLPCDPSAHPSFLTNEENSYGFFDVVPQPDGALPIFGVVQDQFYDRIKAPKEKTEETAQQMKRQLKAFVLEYMMRSSSTRLESLYSDKERSSVPFNLNPDPRPAKNGFDYTQLFYQDKETRKVKRFSEDEGRKIVHLDRIGKDIDWLLVKIDIHNFWFQYQFASFVGPIIGAPTREDLYVLLHPDLMANEDNPSSSEILGVYGYGYTFIENPVIHNIWGYGPEKVSRTFEYMHFRVKKNGEVWAKAAFGTNGPTRMTVDAEDFAKLILNIADSKSSAEMGRYFAPLVEALGIPAVRYLQPDPIFGATWLLNKVTLGLLGSGFDFSREGIVRYVMAQHHLMLYDFIVQTLPTFKMVPDWTQPKMIPDWIKEGNSSD